MAQEVKPASAVLLQAEKMRESHQLEAQKALSSDSQVPLGLLVSPCSSASHCPHPGRLAGRHPPLPSSLGVQRPALSSPAKEGKRHSGISPPRTQSQWPAGRLALPNPAPVAAEEGGREEWRSLLPSAPGLGGEGRASPLLPHIPYRRGPLYDCLQQPPTQQGSGAHPGSANGRTRLAPLQ